jgi:HTH-type transcriptional regulator / antitoxin HigA
MMSNEITFSPDWVSPPGDTILEMLEQQRISLEQFAARLGTTLERIEGIVAGSVAITPEIARNLGIQLGGTPSFWLKRELQFRTGLAKFEEDLDPADVKAWLVNISASEMMRMGWIESTSFNKEKALSALRFFGVSNIKSWHHVYDRSLQGAKFRTSRTFESQPGTLAAWLRQGELESTRLDSLPWDPVLFRKQLESIRGLSLIDDPKEFLPMLQHQCANCGVALSVTRAPKGCRASGATKVLPRNRRLLMLSARFLSDDQFWFTFFHEAGHLLLHTDKQLTIDEIIPESATEEREANEFAERVLIPPSRRDDMLQLEMNPRRIMRFARDLGISPGIVVGQLQHYGKLRSDQFNKLKGRYVWKD